VAVASRLAPADAALLALHHAVTTPAQAAVRLLGLDPFEVAALTIRLGAEIELVLHEAVAASGGPLSDLPARTAPLVEIAAVHHRHQDPRLFVT
jgi:urease accessory protein